MQKESTSALSYHSILLNDFIEQVLTGTIDRNIYDEFLFAIKDKEQGYATKLIKEINLLETKYTLVVTAVKFIETERRVQELHPEYVHPDSENIWKVLQNIIPVRKTDSLQVIATRAAKLVADKKQKEAELANVQKLTETGKADRNYFNRLIVSVSSFHKMQIDRRKMLLCEFVEMWLMMREQQEYMERELNKQR